MTEAEVLALLRKRHVREGPGSVDEFAFFTHVRNGAGFNATRTFDAVAFNLWPSKGLTLHAFEIKCSRSDWLRELKQPAKAEAAASVCDKFSVVAASDEIVAVGELPHTWGLLVVRKGKLVCVKDAPLLPNANTKARVDRSFLAALLKAGGATPKIEHDDVARARHEGVVEGLAGREKETALLRVEYRRLQQVIYTFEREAGVSLTPTNWSGDRTPTEVARALRRVLDGDQASADAANRIRVAASNLRRAADEMERSLPSG